jgi:ribosomal protein S18 acetylase RimI-like enzyme
MIDSFQILRKAHMNEDPWLSKVMNTNCYNTAFNSIEDYSKIEKSLIDKSSFFVTIRTKDSPNNEVIKKNKTIKFVSTMNSYSWEPNEIVSDMNNINVTLYGNDDFQGVMSIANGSFKSDRFHNDPRISKSFANRIKMDWLKDNLSQCRETITYIFTSPGTKNILGFNSMVIKDNSIVIDLIAVSSEFRRLGVATALISASKKLALNRGLLLTVGTQKNNTANDLYLKNGFTLKESIFVSHDTNITFQ